MRLIDEHQYTEQLGRNKREKFINLRTNEMYFELDGAYCKVTVSKNNIVTVSGLFNNGDKGTGRRLLEEIIHVYGEDSTIKLNCYDDVLYEYYKTFGFVCTLEVPSTNIHFVTFRELVRYATPQSPEDSI